MFQVILKDLREKRGLSQRDLAKLLGVSASTIGMWESGKREPNFKTLIKIANFFDVSTDYMMGKDRLIDLVCRGILQLLRHNDITIDELAAKISIDPSKLELMLDSKSSELVEYLEKIAETFGMGVDQFTTLSVLNDFDSNKPLKIVGNIKKEELAAINDELDPDREEAKKIIDSLPEDKRQQAIDYLRYLATSSNNQERK